MIFKKIRKCACFGSTYTKIGTTEKLAWPLYKEDMQIHEVFHIFLKRKLALPISYLKKIK